MIIFGIPIKLKLFASSAKQSNQANNPKNINRYIENNKPTIQL